MKHLFIRLRIYPLILCAPLFLTFRRRSLPRDTGCPPRILIIPQLRRIGDLVCATPLFRAIKEQYPHGYMAVVVAEYAHTKSILQNNPFIDEIIVFTNKEYYDMFGPLRLFRKVRNRRFDWSVNISASVMGTFIGVFARIPNRVKIIKKQRPFSEALTDWMNTRKEYYKEGEHIPALYLKTLRHLDIPPPSAIRKEIFTTHAGDITASRFLKQHTISKGDLVVGVNVSAGNSIKEWSPDKFAELSRQLIDTYNAKIIFIGTKNDARTIRYVNDRLHRRGIEAVGLFSLSDLPSLLKRLSVFISSDTGLMHMAHALRTPLIDIIGPVDPSEQAPTNDLRAVVVTPPRSIRPTIFAFRPHGDVAESKRATEAISVEQVFRAFEVLYNRVNNEKRTL